MITELLIENRVDLNFARYCVPMLVLLTEGFVLLAFATEVKEWLYLHHHRISHQKMVKPQIFTKIRSRVRLAYAVSVYCIGLILFVMCLYIMHVKRDSETMEDVVAKSLKLSPADTVVFILLYLALMIAIFMMSVGSPPVNNFT